MSEKFNHNIQEKLAQHKFDFAEEAWQKMETLLDEQPQPSKKSKKAFPFFWNNNLWLIAVALVALLGTALFFKMEVSSPTLAQITTDNQPIKTKKKNTSTIIPQETNIANSQLTQSQAPETINQNHPFVTPKNNVSNAVTQAMPPKTKLPFLASIPQQLAAYRAHHAFEKTYIQTDRTLYQPGETIWATVYVRDAATNLPSAQSDFVYLEWLSPNGAVQKRVLLAVKNGVAKGDIILNNDLNGGLYQLKAYTNWQRNAHFEGVKSAQKEITIQKAVLPNVRMQLEFTKKAYGGGDEVVAKLELKNLENEPCRHHDFDFTVSLEGEKYIVAKGKTDIFGKANIAFNLAKTLNSNDGLLNVSFSYNGQTESISRAIPIILHAIDLQFLPESGTLFAGIDNKIAFKALNEHGKPADVSGSIYNKKGKIVSQFSTYHQGMGAVVLPIDNNEIYTAILTKPEGISTIYQLPKPSNNGFVIQVLSDSEDFLSGSVATHTPQNLYFTAMSGGKICFEQHFKNNNNNKNALDANLSPNPSSNFNTHFFKIPKNTLSMGVVTLTLFDANNRPQAERLVFVNRDNSLQIALRTDKEKYLPREPVKLSVEVKNHLNEAVEGQFSLAVVDDKLLSFADDKQANILAQLFLQSEVRGKIDEPNFYFEKADKHPEKDQNLALDALLLTQGWRTFGWVDSLALPLVPLRFPADNLMAEGVILDRFGRPLAGVEVFISNFRKTVKTDNNGYFQYVHYTKMPKAIAIEAQYLDYKQHFSWNTERLDTCQFFQKQISVFSKKENQKTALATLSGKILDKATGKPLPLATLTLAQSFGAMKTAVADENGYFKISNLAKGVYVLQINYWSNQLQEVISIGNGEHFTLEAELEKSVDLPEVAIVQYTVPLIKQDNTTQGAVITQADIQNLPSKNISGIAATIAGVSREKKRLQKMEAEARAKAEAERMAQIRKSEAEKVTRNAAAEKARAAAEAVAKLAAIEAQRKAAAEMQVENGKLEIRGSRSNSAVFYIDGVRVNGNSLATNGSEELITEQVLVPASVRIEVIPAEYETVTEQVLAKAESKRLVTVPAEYETVEETIEISPATTKWVKRMADKNCLSQAPNDCQVWVLVEVPARYETISKTVLKTPATTKEVIIPAEYQTISKRVVKNPSTTRTVEVPAEYKTVKRPRVENGIYQPRQFYAPKYEAKADRDAPLARTDFRTTIFCGDVVTDSAGRAEVMFYNSDAMTTFRVVMEGIGKDGSVGRGEQTYFTQMPFGMLAKAPSVVVTGDIVRLPLTLMNNSSEKIKGELKVVAPKGFERIDQIGGVFALDAMEKRTVYPSFKVLNAAENGNFSIDFSAEGFHDAFTEPIEVLKRGFPQSVVLSDNAQEVNWDFELFAPLDSSVLPKFTVYPSAVTDIVENGKRMLRQPTGCFEQTSSANYPNLLVLDFLRTTNTIDPETERKAMDFLGTGYNRLVSYEVAGGGFDWFGKPAAHEDLTAYGLMEFVDMRSVYAVEEDLIDRTAAWLLSRRDGNGGWLKSKRGLDSWTGQEGNVRNAYIVWAICEAGYGGQIPLEIETLLAVAEAENDPYLSALMANALLKMGDQRADLLLKTLEKSQNGNGSWLNKGKTITRSYGKSPIIETTALAALAFLKAKNASESGAIPTEINLTKAIDFIVQSKNEVGFGSTQSTVLAMKALIENAKMNRQPLENGQVTLFVNHRKAGEKGFLDTETKPIVFDNFEKLLQNGKNTARVMFDKAAELSYDLTINYRSALPKNDAACAVTLQTTLSTNQAKMGETVRLTTILTNTKNENLPNTVALVGIPAGLSLQPWQLKALQEKGDFDFYELLDGYIVFHFRGLAADAVRSIDLDLKADIPGDYEAPASVAYLYYTNEFKNWAAPLKVVIGE